MSIAKRLLIAPIVMSILFAQAMRGFMQESVAYFRNGRSL